jgi:aspartyl-tRNA(Asn)/glutamyl-tRNA(Gln) amidotransferase subunit C
MDIDRDEARRVAKLAHLEFDDAGLDRMASEMTKILSYIDQLREVDADAFQERDLAVMTLRDDEPRPSIEREQAAQNAPAFRDGLFVVPQVIGGE